MTISNCDFNNIFDFSCKLDVFQTLPQHEKQRQPCFKESYLSLRGQNETKVIDVSDEPKGREELRTRYKNMSSQVIDVTIECFMEINDSAVRNNLVSYFIKKIKTIYLLHVHGPMFIISDD